MSYGAAGAVAAVVAQQHAEERKKENVDEIFNKIKSTNTDKELKELLNDLYEQGFSTDAEVEQDLESKKKTNKFIGRAAIILLVIAVLFVGWAFLKLVF